MVLVKGLTSLSSPDWYLAEPVYYPCTNMMLGEWLIGRSVCVCVCVSSGVSSCAGPDGRNVRSSGYTRSTGRAWRLCVSCSDGSARPSEQSASHNPPRYICTASHLQERRAEMRRRGERRGREEERGGQRKAEEE